MSGRLSASRRGRPAPSLAAMSSDTGYVARIPWEGMHRESGGCSLRLHGHLGQRRCLRLLRFEASAQRLPGLGKRDVLRETVAVRERPHQMPVIAYCVLQYPTHTLHEHPDWRMRDKDGKPIERVCFNSPYIDYVKQLLAEMMAYEIDGFHLDMVDQGFGPPYGCWCEHCQAKFENNYGHAMPKALSWDAEWEKMMEFRYDSSAAFRNGP